jgi:hypothetical protein
MSNTAQMELVSTGELARRLGRSLSGVRKLEAQGRIPRSATIVGSGRKVWRLDDLPAIERALRENGQRKDRAVA